MNLKIIALVATIGVIATGVGIFLWNTFGNQPPARQLIIEEVEWMFEGDFLTMEISVNNVGTMPITVESISIRRDVAGSALYVDNDPVGIYSGTAATIAGGGGDAFKWNATSSSAPFDLLQWGETYVIKITASNGDYDELTATAPAQEH